FLRGYPVDQLGVFLFCLVITYAIVRHNLLDMDLIMRRGIFGGAMMGLFLVTYSFWFTVVYMLSDRQLSVGAAFGVALLTAFSAGLFWYKARVFLFDRVDRMFYGERYEYRQELSDFIAKKISGVFSLKELGEGLLPLFVGSLGSQHAYLFLSHAVVTDFVVEFVEPEDRNRLPPRLKADSPIVEWMRCEGRYLSRDMVDVFPEFRALKGEELEEFRGSGMELLFPVVSRGQLIGILALGPRGNGKYSLDDINFAKDMVDRVAASLEKEYLQEQLKRHEQELSLISRLSGVMTSSLKIQEVYDAFVAGLREVVDVDWATVALIEGVYLRFEALSTEVGSAWQPGERIPLKGTATEWLVNRRRAFVESNLSNKARFWTGAEFVKRGIRSIVYVPLLVKNEVIGSLIVASRRLRAYTPEQVHLLERLASQVAMPVENSRLYSKAEQRALVDELTGLFNRRYFDECLTREIDRHSRHGGMLSLVLLDLDVFKEYNDKYGHLAGDRVLTTIGKMMEKSIRNVDMAFRYGGDEFAILLPNADGNNAFVVAERVRARIAHEMKGERTGITASLGLATWPSDGVTPDEIVTAADRALYYAKRTGGNRTSVVSKMLPQLLDSASPVATSEKEALSVIYALASTIEARDQYTYGHSRDVSRYSVALAEALDLPSEKVAAISTAALLHDIGKIGIPDEVLNKPSKLDAEEWELIRSHPRLSATIVGHVLTLTSCLPAVLHHHERWDGNGYPSGLKGEAIPLEARILTVADAFEAMISPRPYRDSMSYKEAVDELKRRSGKQFDPRLIEAFLPIALATAPEELETAEEIPPRKSVRKP
ncbi:MAG: diguanylate cyclase, partial [Chloroflexi bacterium]|nr:diguanylate cyclase [Chloroflexota bacterium]